MQISLHVYHARICTHIQLPHIHITVILVLKIVKNIINKNSGWKCRFVLPIHSSKLIDKYRCSILQIYICNHAKCILKNESQTIFASVLIYQITDFSSRMYSPFLKQLHENNLVGGFILILSYFIVWYITLHFLFCENCSVFVYKRLSHLKSWKNDFVLENEVNTFKFRYITDIYRILIESFVGYFSLL